MFRDLNTRRESLEAKRQELREAIANLHIRYSAGSCAAGPTDGVEDLEESAREMEEREEEQSVFVNQQALLEEIEQALLRIDKGTYGWCSECGQPIPEKRLDAIPWAERDVVCEAHREAASG